MPPPTSSPLGSGSCTALTAGDIQVIGVHSDNPDEIALVTLVNLPAGLELHLTDSGWTGTEFQTSEGSVKVRKTEDKTKTSLSYRALTSVF